MIHDSDVMISHLVSGNCSHAEISTQYVVLTKLRSLSFILAPCPSISIEILSSLSKSNLSYFLFLITFCLRLLSLFLFHVHNRVLPTVVSWRRATVVTSSQTTPLRHVHSHLYLTYSLFIRIETRRRVCVIIHVVL